MELEQFVRNYNTEDIINAIIVMSTDYDPMLLETNIPAAEWIASNAIRYNEINVNRKFDIKVYSEMKQIASEIYLPFMQEIMEDAIKQKDNSEEDKEDYLKSMLMKSKNMASRGDAYQFQLMEMSEKFYKPFDSEFMNKLGFTFSCCEKVFIYIYKRYIDILDCTQNDSTKIDRINKHSFKIYKADLYKLFPKDEIDSLIKYLSICPGDVNLKFIGPEDFKPLYVKPIVDFKEYIYFPLFISTLLNFPKMFHYLFIAEKVFDKDAIARYTKNRGDVIERLTKEYFLRLFENVYISLKYPSNNKEYEADITVQSENTTIFAEAKGKLLTLSALKGNLESVKDDIYKAIGKAYEQAIRSINYVENDGVFIEEMENGDKKIYLKDTTWKFPICVMAENFSSIPSEIYKYIEISKEKLMPYAVNIYDLDIITRECASKEEFINYLLFRQMNIKKVTAMDELDFFGYFKVNGLVEIRIDADTIMTMSFTNDFDKKYDAFTIKWLNEFDVK